jgi:putative ABC transport system substrate-binding protein
MREQMIRRRDLISLVGGAVAWPVAAWAQQPAVPVIGFFSGRSPDDSARYGAAFRKGLSQSGFAEGQNVAVEYHWLDGHYDLASSLMADLVRRRVTAIATLGVPIALAAKAATASIPIVFAVADDAVRLGLVPSLARPGGNATGINFLSVEVVAKRLNLLHELLPRATRIAVLVNPTNPNAEDSTLRDASEAARALGMQIHAVKARTAGEVGAAFATMVRDQADALVVGPDAFLTSRRVQIAVTAARHGIPTASNQRDEVEAGALMSYGTDIEDVYRQVGDYTSRVLKGAKPAEMPVQQTTKFEFLINLTTAEALGLTVPPSLLARADEVIE